MAGERTLPGLGLRAYWEKGSNDWEVAHDPDTRKLSILCQAAVISRTTELPSNAPNGAMYLVPAGDTNGNQIAARDDGAWVFTPPQVGFLVHVNDISRFVKWDGSEWVALSTGGADFPLLADNAGNVLAVNAEEDGVEWVSMGGGGDADYPPFEDNAGKVLAVNAAEDGVEWVPQTGGGPGPAPGVVMASFSFAGTPSASQVVGDILFPATLNLPANFTGSLAKVRTAPTDDTAFVVDVNGTQVGTLTFTANEPVGAFVVSGGVTLSAGDSLGIIAPPDLNGLSDLSVVIVGNVT